MKTVSTKIKDFAVGDMFIHYGAILKVTGEIRVWSERGTSNRDEITNDPARWTPRCCYGRSCKFIKETEPGSTKYLGGLITGYDWMQGIEEVTYAKIIETPITMQGIDDCYPANYNGIENI